MNQQEVKEKLENLKVDKVNVFRAHTGELFQSLEDARIEEVRHLFLSTMSESRHSSMPEIKKLWIELYIHAEEIGEFAKKIQEIESDRNHRKLPDDGIDLVGKWNAEPDEPDEPGKKEEQAHGTLRKMSSKFW